MAEQSAFDYIQQQRGGCTPSGTPPTPTAAPTTTPTQTSPTQNQSAADYVQQQTNPTPPPEAQHSVIGDFLRQAAKGALRTANSISSPEEAEQTNYGANPNAGQMPSKNESSAEVEKLIPGGPQGTAGRIGEQIGASATNPLNYAFGPGAAASGLVASGVSGATGSGTLGLLAGIATGSIGNATQRWLNMGNDALTQANERLGTAAGTTLAEGNPESALTRRTYGALIGSPGGTNTLTKAAEARTGAVEGAVNNLAGASDKAAAGADLADAARAQQEVLKASNTDLVSTLMNKADPYADPTPLVDAVGNLRGTLSPVSASLDTPTSTTFMRDFENGLNTALKRAPNGMMPTADLRILRSRIGDMVESAIANGNGEAIGQMKQLYRGLGDSIRSAFTDPADLVAYDNANRQMINNFDQLQRVVTPLARQDVTPEKVFSWVGSEAKLGATKMVDVRNAVGEQAWSNYAGTFLRTLGRDPNGAFNVSTYARRWNNLDPDVQKALFSNTPYADLPQSYKDLELVANRFQQANKNYNSSESGNVMNIAHTFNLWMSGISKMLSAGAGAALGFGAATHGPAMSCFGNAGVGAGGGALLGGWGAADMVQAATTMAASKALSAAVTNPGFVKWASAIVPVKAFPRYANGFLSAVNAFNPSLSTAVNAFVNYATGHSQTVSQNQNLATPWLDKAKQPPQPFLGGGEVTWPCQAQGTGYMNGGYTLGDKSQSTGTNIIDQQGYADGGYANGGTADEYIEPPPPEGGSVEKRNTSNTPPQPASKLKKRDQADNYIEPPQIRLALGGMTQTRKPQQGQQKGEGQRGKPADPFASYPWQGYMGGGSVWGTSNATPFASGGYVDQFLPASDESSAENLQQLHQEMPQHDILSLVGISGQLRNELKQKGLEGFAKGGKVGPDPRPFYNCQLPGVKGGGWAGGGPVGSPRMNTTTEIGYS